MSRLEKRLVDDLSKAEKAIESDISKVEKKVGSELHSLIAPDLKELEEKLDKRANNYIIIVGLLTGASGIGFWMTNDLTRFLIEVLPTTMVGLIIGYLFLKKSDETVKTSTTVIHKALSTEISTLHSKVDSNTTNLALLLERLGKDESKEKPST